jgi:hypothetical protein
MDAKPGPACPNLAQPGLTWLSPDYSPQGCVPSLILLIAATWPSHCYSGQAGSIHGKIIFKVKTPDFWVISLSRNWELSPTKIKSLHVSLDRINYTSFFETKGLNNLDCYITLGCNHLQWQTLQLIVLFCKLQRNCGVVNTTPGVWVQCYKTFYGRYLLLLVISYSVCPWQAFPANYNVCG